MLMSALSGDALSLVAVSAAIVFQAGIIVLISCASWRVFCGYGVAVPEHGS